MITHPRRFFTCIPVVLILAVVFTGCAGQSPPECELLTWDGYEITITLMDGSEEKRQVYPSEEGLDADGDEVDDCVEFLNGTDPNDPDTARDGLLDGRNVTLEAGDDRIEEWTEQGIVHTQHDNGSYVFVGSGEYGLNPTVQDQDSDGILDGEEVGGFSVWILGEERRVTTNPNSRDTSSDGMSDGFKRDAGLDPSVKDTNGDGVPDSEDVNPWIEFKLRLEVVSLNLSEDPHGRNEANLEFILNLPRLQERSMGMARTGETTDGDEFSINTMHPYNGRGNFRAGDHNVTFDLTVLTQSGGEQRRVDLFSQSTPGESLIGAIHALTGDLYHGNARDPWPSTATFEGEHGNITLRLVPVWPDDWQACIDDGCRHGDGEFQWR